MNELITSVWILQFYPDNMTDTRLISVYDSYSNAHDAVTTHSRSIGTVLDFGAFDMTGVIESYSQDGKLFGSYEMTEIRLNTPLPKGRSK